MRLQRSADSLHRIIRQMEFYLKRYIADWFDIAMRPAGGNQRNESDSADYFELINWLDLIESNNSPRTSFELTWPAFHVSMTC
jgi:hypothetical protein